MIVVGLDSCEKAASVAVVRNGVLLCEQFRNNGLTHSQTLAPMLEAVLLAAGLCCGDVDVFAVNAGPGSFTGIRIGVSLCKAVALAADKPCCAVSALESLARNVVNCRGLICAAMDARRGQVYCALFESDGNTVTRLCEDRACAVTQIAQEIKNLQKPTVFVGEGAMLCYNECGTDEGMTLACEPLRHGHAASVALAGEALAAAGRTIPAQQLQAVYLRPSQAERELAMKQGGQKQ